MFKHFTKIHLYPLVDALAGTYKKEPVYDKNLGIVVDPGIFVQNPNFNKPTGDFLVKKSIFGFETDMDIIGSLEFCKTECLKIGYKNFIVH